MLRENLTFAHSLEQKGSCTAIIDPFGKAITYLELAEHCKRAEDEITSLSKKRVLLMIEMIIDTDSIASYLAALRLGYPAILVSGGLEQDHRRVIESFQPEIVRRSNSGWGICSKPECGSSDLHPDLSLLLSTSGSTGSPKLVKLTGNNLNSNAQSIATYLEIKPSDRAIISLPFQYSYGLSVLNSHLYAGASVTLVDRSIVDPMFWETFERSGSTSIAGVPYSYELFERVGLRQNHPSRLRTMTQAGGKLSPEMVSIYQRFAVENNIKFYVMYGQTEATARMSYLPPDLVKNNPTAIGKPIPGGSFQLRDANGRIIEEPEEAGELVYSGPNVMMGYANVRGDLSKGCELSSLETGDIAKRDKNGLYHILGRNSRFIKIAGLRIGLDDIETLLRTKETEAIAVGHDGLLAIAVPPKVSIADTTAWVSEKVHLPLTTILVFHCESIPRLASGKIDYSELGKQAQEIIDERLSRGGKFPHNTLAIELGQVLGVASLKPTDSFSSLGGDSLSYIGAAVCIERYIGQLPPDWEHLSVEQLSALTPASPQLKGAWNLRSIESELVLRVAALLFVMVGHAEPVGTEAFRGGALILFMLGGFSLARFQRESFIKGMFWPSVRGALLRSIMPYYLVMIALLFYAHNIDRSLSWYILTSTFFVERRGLLFDYWFIEAIFHSLLIIVGLMSFPTIRNFSKLMPFASGLSLIAISVVMNLAVPLIWTDPHFEPISVNAWFYAFAIGWTLYLAKSRHRQMLIIALASVLSAYNWGILSGRHVLLTIAVVVLSFIPLLRMPSPITRLLSAISGSAYFIYLFHVLVVHVLRFVLPIRLTGLELILSVQIVSMVGGVAIARAWSYVRRAAHRVAVRLSMSKSALQFLE